MYYNPKLLKDKSFTAIDFESANRYPNSACAIGMVRVENNQIVKEKAFLIKPPSKTFEFTYIHNIRWEDVKNEPSFYTLWPSLEPFLSGVDFFVAHNSTYDERVLRTCCKEAGIIRPKIPFLCTVKLARKIWKVFPTKLPDVAKFLDLTLQHHDALSDARASANIVLKSIEKETSPSRF